MKPIQTCRGLQGLKSSLESKIPANIYCNFPSISGPKLESANMLIFLVLGRRISGIPVFKVEPGIGMQ